MTRYYVDYSDFYKGYCIKDRKTLGIDNKPSIVNYYKGSRAYYSRKNAEELCEIYNR